MSTVLVNSARLRMVRRLARGLTPSSKNPALIYRHEPRGQIESETKDDRDELYVELRT
jgi:hypothetical protein